VSIDQRIARSLPGLAVSAQMPDRTAYSRDLWPRRLIDVRAGRIAPSPPAAIVWPESVEQVAAVVRWAQGEGLPLVPFGAGSGVCGGIEPDARAIVIDMKKLSAFRVRPEAPLVDVGAGALGLTLEEELGRQGYTIGHFPSSILCSTVGGWIAARGAGQCSGLYGKIEDMVASLECVLGTGEIVRLRRRRSDPDLVPLMVGSEGTLAVVTSAELRLHPAPAARAFAAFSYADIVAGWEALRALFQEGLRPAVSRLYDPIDSFILAQGAVKPEIRPKNPFPGVAEMAKGKRKQAGGVLGHVLRTALRAPAAMNRAIQAAEGNVLGGSTLVLVFEGESDVVHADCERAMALCRSAGGQFLGEGPARAWLAHRYSVSYRQSPVFRMGAFSDTMEVAAPWSRLETLYDDVRRALGDHVLVMAHLSHAYPDGCSIYFTFSGLGRDDDEAAAIYERAWRDALGAALAAGATLSHHHGVGRSKAPRLGEELGLGVDLVQGLMRAWDPSRIMNPGALAPSTSNVLQGAESSSAQVSPAAIDVDERSLLADVASVMTLGAVEQALEERGLTLGLQGADLRLTLGQWIAEGLSGAPDAWSDPVDQVVAGVSATLHDGRRLLVRPAPRRAVGPDLRALFIGCHERLGRIERAVVRVRRRDASTARELPFSCERDPAMSEGERAAWERVVTTLGAR
jgi:alkyldihydroxyacetonephosphate synthase